MTLVTPLPVPLRAGVTETTPAAGGAANQTDTGPGAKLLLDNEPDWNAAEEAAAGSRWDDATDGYLKTLRTTQKDWLKTRAAVRLLDVAARAHRYDAVVAAYLSLVHTDPAQASSRRPILPDTDSTYIDTALAATAKALAEPNLTDEQQQALLSLQLDLYRIRKDDTRADAVLQRLTRLASESTTPGSARRYADAKLAAARLAYDRHDYSAAIAAVNAASAAMTDPSQQEDALFLLARSLDAKAAAADDPPAALKDAGLAYMRVVAHFQDAPASRHVAGALAGCASVMERLKETKIAADLYEQAAILYDTRPEAQAARDRAARLRAGAARP